LTWELKVRKVYENEIVVIVSIHSLGTSARIYQWARVREKKGVQWSISKNRRGASEIK